MSRKPKQTVEQAQLQKLQLERAKELRVENAKQTTKAFSDNLAFRRKLRGIFSLLSGGFKGFPQGVPGAGSSGSAAGGTSLSSSGGPAANSGGGISSPAGGIPSGGARP